jgi:hypothetical protein
MGWLKRDREADHQKWLAAHPGKEATKSAPPMVTDEEKDRIRARMEQELEDQRSKRQQA